MKRKLTALIMAVFIAIAPTQQANAIFGFNIVFDPKNFGQNLLTAARTLQMINQQAQAIQQRINMIRAMEKNLERLDDITLSNLNRQISQLNVLMQQAGQIAFDVDRARAVYQQTFPGAYQAQMSNNQMARYASQQWTASTDALRHAINVQAQISENVIADVNTLNTIIDQSQNAAGSLQAAQAGNQLQALSIRQNTDTLQLLAAQGRAVTLAQARAAEAEKIAIARLERFIGDGRLYTPIK